MRAGGAFVIAFCLGAGEAPAQSVGTVAHFPLPLIDLSVAPDTVSGLHVLMQPSLESKEGKAGRLIWLVFDPDTVLAWINSAAAALTVPVPNGPTEGIQWSKTLRPRGGQGGLLLGRALKKGKLEKTRWFAIGDSLAGWRAELTASQGDSLLHLLLNLSLVSRIDTAISPPRDFRDGDAPVTVIYQPQPRQWGKIGRVVATYVVDETGKADPASFVAWLASDPA